MFIADSQVHLWAADSPQRPWPPGRAAEALGGLEILVHCAAFVGTSGLPGWVTPLAEQSAETWRRCLEVNLTSAFVLAQAVSLEALEKAHAEGGSEALDQFLLPADSGLEHWPLLQFSEHSAYYWLHGQPVRAPEAPKFGMVRVQDHNGRFIGIGEVSEDGRIAPRRLISTSA